MTDLEKLENTFSELGIIYDKSDFDIIQNTNFREGLRYDCLIEIDHGAGYMYFNCKFYFFEGKFQGHGCWE